MISHEFAQNYSKDNVVVICDAGLNKGAQVAVFHEAEFLYDFNLFILWLVGYCIEDFANLIGLV